MRWQCIMTPHQNAQGKHGLIDMAYQGKLDALCGPYAIVKAYDRRGVEEG